MADCPACGKAAEARFAPFCSARCQQIDLGRWLKGDYVIPAAPDENRREGEAPAQAPGTGPAEEE
jgi:endogenous inhibitor of DNA gyrase (YacG/DUF329 family)